MDLPIAAKSGQQHTEEEWERIRGVFVTLYITNGKSLSEVRRILAETHGFFATQRQYKTRILKWGVLKKTKEQQPNPRSTPATKKAAKVARLAGNPVPGTFLFQLERPPAPPGHLGLIHVASHGVSRFYSGVLNPGVDTVRVLNQTKEWNIRRFYDVSNTVSGLAEVSRWKTAQPLYGEMLDHVIPLLEDRNPIVVICLIQICCRFLQQGQGPVLKRFLSFVTRMAAAQRLESHPLRLLSSAWSQSTEHALDLMVMCAEQAVDVLSKDLGPEHAQTLSARRALEAAKFTHGDYEGAIKALENVAETEQRLYPQSFAHFDARFRVIQCYLAMNDLDSAEKALQEIDDYKDDFIKTCKIELQINQLELYIAQSRGDLLRLRKDPAAIPVLENAFKRAERAAGGNDSWLLLAVGATLAAAREEIGGNTPSKCIPWPC